MTDFSAYFKNKKITVMGLGLLGRGLGDALYLAEMGAEVTVTDLKSEEQLADSVAMLKPYKNVQFVLGEHCYEDFENKDLILVAAGVPLDSPYLAHARAKNVRLTMSGVLLAELSQLPVIGVTGTRGKSTVSQMIHHTLLQSGTRSILGGNVRGVSNLQLLKEAVQAEVLVLELDSWQLQGWGWSERSPQIAVFTNFMSDHQNYYPDMETYFADKANIYRYQRPGDALIAGTEVAKEWIAKQPTAYGMVVPETLPDTWTLMIPGVHNRDNASLAAEALRAFDLSEADIKHGLETFAGVEGRLQFVKEVNGVRIYNDNNATTPVAVALGLQALADKKNVVLITGGTDKELELTSLPEMIEKHAKHLILYSGTGTERLKGALSRKIPREEYSTLKECVASALAVAQSGDVLLYSPGFASFAKEFKNEYDRNDQFLALIHDL